MWFKQSKLFQLTETFKSVPSELAVKLEPLAFRPCPPSLFTSMGWVSPVEENNMPLVEAINGYIMLCLQIEEKILPAIVIRQELIKKIKMIEGTEGRKVRQKEKNTLKDELIITLLPRAFTKLSRVYGYINSRNNELIIGSTNQKKLEHFLSMFTKSFNEEAAPFVFKELSPLLTEWLKSQNYPSTFAIEKSCTLQDPNQQNRVIRCQQQDLFASSMQALIKEGYAVKQIALSWQDRIQFMLSEHCVLSAIKFQEEIISQAKEMEPGTEKQEFHADFLMMTETLSQLLKDLQAALLASTQTDRGNIVPMAKQA